MPSNRIPNLVPAIPDRAEPAKIWKARSYIHEHLDDELSLNIVAKSVQISPNHLSEKFKEVTGVKFVDYVARRRFARACLLLVESTLKISEIAFEVGFQSLSQFNRVFKRLSGQSPTEYRSQQQRRPSDGLNGADERKNAAKTLAVEMRSRPPMVSNRLRLREAISYHAMAQKQS